MNEKNFAVRQFAETYAQISLFVPFQEAWHNGTGYLDHAVDYKVEEPGLPIDHVSYGKRWKSIDPNGRKIIGVITPFGNVVVFERYSHVDHELNQRIVSNVPDDLRGVVQSPLTSSEMVISILGFFDFDNNIGTIFGAYYKLGLRAGNEAIQPQEDEEGRKRTIPHTGKKLTDHIFEVGNVTSDMMEGYFQEISAYNWEALSGESQKLYTMANGEYGQKLTDIPASDVLGMFKLTAINLVQEGGLIPDNHNQGRKTQVDGLGAYVDKNGEISAVPLILDAPFSVNPIKDGCISTGSIGPVVTVKNDGGVFQLVSAYNADVDMCEKRPNNHYFVAFVIFKQPVTPIVF